MWKCPSRLPSRPRQLFAHPVIRRLKNGPQGLASPSCQNRGGALQGEGFGGGGCPGFSGGPVSSRGPCKREAAGSECGRRQEQSGVTWGMRRPPPPTRSWRGQDAPALTFCAGNGDFQGPRTPRCTAEGRRGRTGCWWESGLRPALPWSTHHPCDLEGVARPFRAPPPHLREGSGNTPHGCHVCPTAAPGAALPPPTHSQLPHPRLPASAPAAASAPRSPPLRPKPRPVWVRDDLTSRPSLTNRTSKALFPYSTF